MVVWMDGRTDGWIDGRTDGWIEGIGWMEMKLKCDNVKSNIFVQKLFAIACECIQNKIDVLPNIPSVYALSKVDDLTQYFELISLSFLS
mgnify:CR=1 FL=1